MSTRPLSTRLRRFGAPLAALAVLAAVPAAAQANVDIGNANPSEGPAGNRATLVVSRSASLLSPAITVSYVTEGSSAVAGEDFVAVSGTLRFPAAALGGTQVQHINVPIIDDQLPENTEGFRVLIGGPGISRQAGVVKILDDDPPAPPGRLTSVTHLRHRQMLIARTPSGGEPNAPASDLAISWDARTARYIAYVSTATDIVAGSGNRKNVYLVRRGGKPSKWGSWPWKFGSVVVASRGLGGAPADGDSWSPVLDGWSSGDQKRGPTCLAFVSSASNLVAGDTNGQADVFVRKFRGSKLRRIASPPGKPAEDVNVSGDCRVVAYTAGGSLYAKRGSKRPRKLVGSAAKSPDVSAHGDYVSYGRNGRVYMRRVSGGGARRVGTGLRPSADGDRPGGKFINITYQRGNKSFVGTVGGRGERHIGLGILPAMTAGGAQIMFAHGPFVFKYAMADGLAQRLPKGYCPPGMGSVNDLATSSRGNYEIFSCTAGTAYMSYLGPK